RTRPRQLKFGLRRTGVRGLSEDNDGVTVTSRPLLTSTNEVTRWAECPRLTRPQIRSRGASQSKKGFRGRPSVPGKRASFSALIFTLSRCVRKEGGWLTAATRVPLIYTLVVS
ncbi:hypothetical protein Pcinc_041465, partial [Petrolisthes cinctipes]